MDAIAVAKKEFEAINAVRNEQLLPKTALPRASAFEFPALPVSPPPIVAPTAKTPPRDLKTGNWLIDAMARETESRETRGGNSQTRGRRARSAGGSEDAIDAARGQFNGGEAREDGSEGARKTNEDAAANYVVNPLTRYLGEWMTPQDYALLKPGLAASFNGRAYGADSAGVGEARDALKPGGALDSALGGASAPALHVIPSKRENPFLEPLRRDLPLNAINGTSKPLVVAPVTSVAPTLTPPPARTLPPTKIPDFAKPPADDKYFKPLKRF